MSRVALGVRAPTPGAPTHATATIVCVLCCNRCNFSWGGGGVSIKLEMGRRLAMALALALGLAGAAMPPRRLKVEVHVDNRWGRAPPESGNCRGLMSVY